jgi:hypothetical protein
MSQDSAEEIKKVIEEFLERTTSIAPGKFPIFGMIAGSKSFNLNLQSSDTVIDYSDKVLQHNRITLECM